MAFDGSFTTISSPVRTELKIRNSRFIGTAMPVRSREEAMEAVARIQKEFWDASHNCYAFRLAPDGLQYRFSDDGEPSGSAGKPILFVLQQRSLLNVLVVITRYFGGTKLGVGGLVRAYGDTAAAALDAATVLEEFPTDRLRVYTTYEDIRVIRPLVERYAIRFEEEYLDAVHYVMVIRSDQVEPFAAELTDASQGRAGWVRLDHIEVP
ncbi:MAG TPA: YigZ family protein [Candidatus Kapabacteria bacterium]|nr:YigZ family protein [Candidatus Kapabacteria bacterium]